METVKDIECAELVTYDEKDRIFHLANDTISYIIQIEESDVLAHIYFGKRIKGYDIIKTILEEIVDSPGIHR